MDAAFDVGFLPFADYLKNHCKGFANYWQAIDITLYLLLLRNHKMCVIME